MAFASFSASSQLPKLPEKAFHPDKSFDFPSREFGKNVKTRSCQASGFSSWPWLTYDLEKDVVFCLLCVKSLESKKMTMKRDDHLLVIQSTIDTLYYVT